MPINKYIYNGDVKDIFHEKLDDFHEKYVLYLLLSGVASKGSDIESIKMTKNPDTSLKYCQKVVGGLKNIKPNIITSLTEDGNTLAQCIFTHLSPKECILVQNVMNWTHLDDFSCQVCYLGEISVSTIESHLE